MVKYILIIVAATMWQLSYAQSKTVNLKDNHSPSITFSDTSGGRFPLNGAFFLRDSTFYDTVRVLILYSDTLLGRYLKEAHWDFGYQIYSYSSFWITGSPPISLLNNNKKPIPKGIIIWQVVQLDKPKTNFGTTGQMIEYGK